MANSAAPVQKPTEMDLHRLLRQSISGFSRTRVKSILNIEYGTCSKISKNFYAYIFAYILLFMQFFFFFVKFLVG